MESTEMGIRMHYIAFILGTQVLETTCLTHIINVIAHGRIPK